MKTKCERCGKMTDDDRMLCGECYGEGKIPDTIKKGGKRDGMV